MTHQSIADGSTWRAWASLRMVETLGSLVKPFSRLMIVTWDTPDNSANCFCDSPFLRRNVFSFINYNITITLLL